MDKTACCPKCNYRENSDVEFQVCPACGLIIAKYFLRKNFSETTSKSDNRNPSVGIKSQTIHKTRYLKKLIIGALCLNILTVVFIFLHKYSETDSGTIVWSQSSNYSNGLASAIAIEKVYIYVVASDRSKDSRYGRWHIEKRSSLDGSFVRSFGSEGIIIGNIGRSIGIAADSQYIYVIGVDYPDNGDSQWRIEKRWASDGLLVNGFGDHGVITTNPKPYGDQPEAIVIDANFMYIVGSEEMVPGYRNPPHSRSDSRWRIEKRKLLDGSLATDFGDGGIITSNPNEVEGDAGMESARAIAIDADFMYVVGTAYNAAPIDLVWRIEKRHLTDGSLCTEFGDKGSVSYNPSSGFDEAHSIAIDAKYMYVVGHDMSSGSTHDHQWHIEKRNLTDGTLVGGFGSNGIVTNDPSNRVNWAHAIVLDRKQSLWERIVRLDLMGNRQAMYVAGKDESPGPGDQQWRIEKRKLTDGSLDNKFSQRGNLTINPSSYSEQVRAMTADTGYIYIVGDDYANGNSSAMWRIVKIKK
jgi:hypothetical protein